MPGSRVRAALLQTAPDYTVQLQARQHAIVSDEPAPMGGSDAGFRPFELALSGLASCTAITLRMYAARKGWQLGDVHVEARIAKEGDAFTIDRTVSLGGDLSDEQRTRLAEICEKTPVTLLIKRGATIATTLQRSSERPTP
jgi:putative redox protein